MRINIHAGIEYHEVGLAVTVEIVHHHYGIVRLCPVHDELGGVAEPTVILAQPCRRGTYPAAPLNGGVVFPLKTMDNDRAARQVWRHAAGVGGGRVHEPARRRT